MGDTKKFTNKFSTPNHPWKRDRIEVESALRKNYGLKNTREVWKVSAKLKGFKDQIKGFMGRSGNQVEVERAQLQGKLQKYGIMPEDGNLENVLNYKTEMLLERRLQTIIVRKKLAHSMNQARQFIVHRHVTVDGKVITAPGYLVTVSEESAVAFKVNSTLSDDNHPERMSKEDAAAKRAEEKEARRKLAELKAQDEAEVIEVTEDDSE